MMELFTRDNVNFIKQDTIDVFISAIWTERYYGDGDVIIVLPDTEENRQKLAVDTIIGLLGSNELRIVETHESEEGNLKVIGISLLKWMNNRFIRTSNDHEVRTWYLTGYTPGHALAHIVQQFLIGGPYLDGTIPIGIPLSALVYFPISGLVISSYDNSGSVDNFSIPFGPVYDALHDIAVAYEIGMALTYFDYGDGAHELRFKSYKGINRTSAQSVNPNVKFSIDMDTLSNPKELHSKEGTKTLLYMYSSSNFGGLANNPGRAGSIPVGGFKIRAGIDWADGITDEQVGGSAATLLSILEQRSFIALNNRRYVALVDGEVIPSNEIQYGTDFFLGDLVEFQGNSDTVSNVRITEYIRVQDASGERSYPTFSLVE